MALGATRARILGSVIGEGLGLALSGVVLGTIAALFATRVLRNFVWEVSTARPGDVRRGRAAAPGRLCAASAVPAMRPSSWIGRRPARVTPLPIDPLVPEISPSSGSEGPWC